MKQQEQIKNLLVNKGWRYKSSCHCGGSHTLKYELKTIAGEYKLHIRYSNFSLAQPGGKLIKYPIQGLEKTIDEIYRKHKEDIQAEAKN